MPGLAREKCVPCQGNVPPVSESERKDLLKQIPDWRIVERGGAPELERVFKFKEFRDGLNFVARVGDMAEAEDHHPAVLLEWGRVTVRWSTHKIRNLHRNDFIMASKTDALYSQETAAGRAGP
jgi:4a-hydroxytetrahydrobiopterin dehydratase